MPDLRLKDGESAAERMHAGMGTDACSHVSHEACCPCWGVSHACGHAWLAHAGMHRVVTLLQYSTASDTRQHVSGLMLFCLT